MKEKKLNEKEIAIKNYEVQSQELISEGYKENKEVTSISKASIKGVLLCAPIIALFYFLYILKWDKLEHTFYELSIPILFSVILSTIPHELLHGLGWGIFCKEKFKSIRFGFMKSNGTPYCNCKEPLKFKGYLFGAILPIMILGILISIISIVTGNSLLWWFGIANIFIASGDLAIISDVLKHIRRNGVFLDHPTECGFLVFTK